MTDQSLIAAPDPTAVPVTPPVAEAAPVAAAAPTRPDGLPDTFWDDAVGVKPEAFSRLAELEAADAARKAGIPESADKYELKIADTIVGLDGKPVQFDATDPLAQAVLPVLHELGIPQEGVSKLLGAFAAQEIEAAKEQQAFVASEQAKLGAAHKDRTSALHGQIVAAVGAEQAEVIRQHATSAAAVIALENLMSKVTGVAVGAAPPAQPGSSYDEIAGLPPEQRLAAARALKAG
jgi:hypothetical protein